MTTASDRIVSIVSSYVGCSLEHDTDRLAELVARGVDHPGSIVRVKTNCGTFALGVLHAAGVPHELLEHKYRNEMAIAWIIQVANDCGAIRYPKRDGQPPAGALLHYWVRQGTKTVNHHVEFCLETPTATWIARHAGGGRPKNAITDGVSDIRWNASRPLQAWYDPDELMNGRD